MIRTGIGFDAHRFESGRKLILGGREIPHKMGLAGHSDADVLTHAIADALLGSVGEGDIGTQFPDTDDKWKDAVSLELLKHVVKILFAKEAFISNIDATVIAEKPKLTDHIKDMRFNLAGALGLQVDRVSIKATTVEGMGALGRGEGIAALAVATVETHP